MQEAFSHHIDATMMDQSIVKDVGNCIEEDHGELERNRRSLGAAARKECELMRAHPSIPAVTLFIFSVLCAAGISLCIVFRNTEYTETRDEALLLATETGNRFSDLLDLAILPLYGLAQFAQELDIFHPLPDQIGPAGEEGSAPFLPPSEPGDPPTHRNVSGVCNDPELVSRFNEIASTIKKNSGGEGVIVNLQLAPEAVVCLAYPLVNTEDFEDDVVMNNTGAIGHDLLNDPNRKFIAEQTVPADGVVIAGPLTLVQGGEEVVEQAFIARLPIVSDDHIIQVNGVPHNRWGFAVTLINWKAVVERTGIYHEFAREGCDFRLTRTDQIYDEETGTYNQNVVVLAESPHFDDESSYKEIVTQSVQTTNNEWIITIKYSVSGNLPWLITAVVVVSLLISLLVYTILIQKQIHSDSLARKSAMLVDQARASARAEREMNDYIAHEVRNPISAAMSACSFVASAVHESQPLMDVESQQNVREDVAIIETSLQFVNDLLRSMLDLHRASSNQMVVDNSPVDVLSDILHPVASMLYRRDDIFEVLIECPENLVVVTDRLRLKQVVLNLARNAIKFVEEGFVRLYANVVDGRVRIYVEDSGPGIPVDKRNQLFCKFQDSLDSLSQGTGVGLSLCKNLVDLMGGELWLDGSYASGYKDHQGARFILDLKTAPVSMESFSSLQTQKTAADTVSSSGVQGDLEDGSLHCSRELPERLSVLFVDDDMTLRKLFCRSLRKNWPNWTVSEAASGEVALAMLEERTFDVIFIDQYMSSVEKQLLGTETTRALRAKGVKSIICGLSANDLEATFKIAGADAFVMKPFPCKPEPLKKEMLRILYDEE